MYVTVVIVFLLLLFCFCFVLQIQITHKSVIFLVLFLNAFHPLCVLSTKISGMF